MSRPVLGAAALLLWGLALARAQQGGGPQLPNWLPENVRDAMNDLDSSTQNDGLFGDEPCRARLELVKKLSMVARPEANQIQSSVLNELGFCDLKAGKHAAALRRFDSAVSVLNAPSDEALMQNQNAAPLVLMKQAAKALKDFKVSEAGVAMRRSRAISQRNWQQVLKQVMKHNKIPEEALPQAMPKLRKERFAVRILGLVEELDSQLARLDGHLVKDKLHKDRKGRLDGAAGGSLAYLAGLPMEATAESSRLLWLDPLREAVAALAGEVAEARPAKHVTLLKRTKPGSDCDKYPKLCAALQGVPDVSTNGFGESRLLVLKRKKTQKLDLCETNGNLGVLITLKGDAKLAVGPKPDATGAELPQGSAVVYDLCLESALAATTDDAQVLFLQAWHPEVAALERTTFIREKAKAVWNLDEAAVKAVTAVVNSDAKKTWEKAAKQWRAGSTLLAGLEESLQGAEQKQREEKLAQEEKEKTDAEAADKDAEAAKEELERKRKEKQAAEEAKKEEKRRRVAEARKKELEREPWRQDPRVVEAREKLTALQEERREANQKMEFDESTKLTKEVSKAERKLESVMEKAKKYYKKHGKVKEGKEKDKAKGDNDGEAAAEPSPLQSRLKELQKQKKAAAEQEDFKEAARLKKEIEEVKKQMGSAEL